MDGLAEALQGILSSEEGQKQIKAVADMLGFSDETPSLPAPVQSETDALPVSELLKLTSLIKSFNADDQNTNFLRALKPLLQPERQAKVEQAIRLMKIIALLPLLRENGWIKDLLGGLFELR